MHSIPIHISGKVALCPRRYLISSNSDYVLTFTFDSEWDGVPAKTARVLFDDRCLDLPFTGSAVLLPKIPPCASLSVGVFSDSLATTAAELGCILSVADSDAEVWNALTETQYDRLLSMLNALQIRSVTSLSLQGDVLTIGYSDSSRANLSLSSLRGDVLLPAPGAEDEGKIAVVAQGAWTAKAAPDPNAQIAAWMDTHFAAYCEQAGLAAVSAEGVRF